MNYNESFLLPLLVLMLPRKEKSAQIISKCADFQLILIQFKHG